MACPFSCGFGAANEYAMLLHIETEHAEGSSPFVANDDSSVPEKEAQAEDDYVECPIDDCGEIITFVELEDHIELHAAEEAEVEDVNGTDDSASPGNVSRRQASNTPEPPLSTTASSSSYRSPYPQLHGGPRSRQKRSTRREASDDRQANSIQKWKQILRMPSPKKTKSHSVQQSVPEGRLGKSELGKYAEEDKMPDWLVSLLRKEGQVTCAGVISVLEQLLVQNPSTEYAFLCHPQVEHVSKLRREGGFCGYRNIQMMSSYIIATDFVGAERFRGRLPSIFRIQDYIEKAWDLGINAQGRIETGGVRGTRKYIGTPEAQAMFLSLGIPCEIQAFKDHYPGSAEAELIQHVNHYFQAADFDPRDKVRCTALPPLYFQHRGHSLTIVGLEKRQHGQVNLLVFDPMFRDSQLLTKHIGLKFAHKAPDRVLKLYRRGNRYLRKYHEFEVLRLKQPAKADEGSVTANAQYFPPGSSSVAR